MDKGNLARLSRFVTFVLYPDHVVLHHTARGETYEVSQDTYAHLQSYAGFQPIRPSLMPWMRSGVLVSANTDTFAFHEGKPDSEAAMGVAYHDWYWRHEAESEREYRWLGQVVMKMPADLFYYQEILTQLPNRRVLELGYGYGGALNYFASVLGLLGGGTVVGLDKQVLPTEWEEPSYPGVALHHVQVDALVPESKARIQAISPHYDVVIADLGGAPSRNLQALAHWASVLTPGGAFVIEDLWGTVNEEAVIQGIDTFLL